MRSDFDRVLRSGDWPAFATDRTVLLETEPSQAIRRPGKVCLVAYHNTSITIDADSPDGGWLVLNDIWHPWWFATLDGKDVAILKANVLFRAIELPPGRHTVHFAFEPVKGAVRQFE